MTGTTRAVRTTCPSCEGTVPRGEGSRAERCPYCGHRSLVLRDEPEVLRYALPPAIEPAEALAVIREALLDKEVINARSLDGAAFSEPVLYYVPFLWISGVVPYMVTREVKARDRVLRQDTRVTVEDYEVFEPAVSLPGWGLRELEVGTMLAKPFGPLPEPFDATALRRHGRVLAAQKRFDESLALLRGRLERMTPEGEAPVEPIAERHRLLWVPLWSVVYTIRGRRYEARIEAVNGSLISARAPEDDRWRVPMALAAIFLPAFLVGKLLRLFLFDLGMVGPLLDARMFVLLLFILLLSSSLFLSLLALAWRLLRYEAEYVYENGRLRAEHLGGEPTTVLDRLARSVADAIHDHIGGPD